MSITKIIKRFSKMGTAGSSGGVDGWTPSTATSIASLGKYTTTGYSTITQNANYISPGYVTTTGTWGISETTVINGLVINLKTLRKIITKTLRVKGKVCDFSISGSTIYGCPYDHRQPSIHIPGVNVAFSPDCEFLAKKTI